MLLHMYVTWHSSHTHEVTFVSDVSDVFTLTPPKMSFSEPNRVDLLPKPKVVANT